MASVPANSITLISSGLADTRLLAPRGNPNPAQFLKVLHKTTRYAAAWSRVDFDGAPEFGQRVSLTLPRIGQLISGVTIAITMPDIYATQLRAIQAAGGTSLNLSGNFLGPLYGWTNSLGHAVIQQIELEIGGTVVETFDSRLLEILDELYEPVEALHSKNAMICRAAHGFGARTWLSSTPTQLFIPIPFWFSKRGVYGNALPIQALTSDVVRIHVTLRPLEQLVYTEARVDARTVGYREGTDTVDGMWGFLGGRYWRSAAAAPGRVYSMYASMPAVGISGELIPDITRPQRLSPIDAYALVEYIHLEEYEAMLYRSGELTYHVEQHVAVPTQNTNGVTEMRLMLPYTNPTKELLWVFQRPEAEAYNAWFLFTRDLTPYVPPRPIQNPPIADLPDPRSPCLTPWWPDADLNPTADRRWQVRPGFLTAYSEPFAGAMLMYNSIERCVHEGGSFFRGVVPSRYYTKPALINRYVYAYSFGLKSAAATPFGMANWDKIPRKELYITLNAGRRGASPPALNMYLYITTWNVFKVFGGRGGMLFTS
jgi:hypothetical protein